MLVHCVHVTGKCCNITELTIPKSNKKTKLQRWCNG